MKRRIATTLILFTLALPGTRLCADETASDVLAVAPADAWGAICVRNMGEMDKKLNTLVQQLNVPFPFQNPLTMGLSMLGFISGVDGTGGVGVVILPAPSFAAMKDHTALLVPTTNLSDLLSLMEPTEVEPGVSKVLLQNEEMFVAHKATHAVFSPSLDALKAVLVSKESLRSKLNAHQLKHFQKDDLMVWANAEAITASEAFNAMAPMLQLATMDAEALKEFHSAGLSLRITPAGIGIGLYVDSIPGTDTHKVMCSDKGTDDSLLLGLPKDRYVLGYGAISAKEASELGAEMLVKAFDNPQFQMLGLDPEKLERVKSMVAARVKLLRTLSVGISALPEGPDGMISLTKVVGMDGNPAEGLAMAAELVAILKGGLIPQEEAASILSALEYKAAAERIDGISVDHLILDLAKAAGEDPEAPEQAEKWIGLVNKIVGKEGILFRLGVVDADHAIVTFGGGAERFKTVAMLVKEKKTPLAEDGGIQRCKTHLPPTCSAEAYLAVDQLLSVIAAIAKVIDEPIPPLSLGELNAPVAFTTTPVEKGGSQNELFIPMELVIAAKDLAMASMGGMGGPGGPPPQAGPIAPKKPDEPAEEKPAGEQGGE